VSEVKELGTNGVDSVEVDVASIQVNGHVVQEIHLIALRIGNVGLLF
jgi:hypothetical protein